MKVSLDITRPAGLHAIPRRIALLLYSKTPVTTVVETKKVVNQGN